jgi:hypothetical protein
MADDKPDSGKLYITRKCGNTLKKYEPILGVTMTVARCTKKFDHHRGIYGTDTHSDGLREWEPDVDDAARGKA